MKLIFTGDLHISNGLYLAKIVQAGVTDRLLDVLATLDAILEAEADAIFILGDLFHNRLLDAPTATMMGRVLARHIRDIFVLPGNHDAHDSAGIHYNVRYLEQFEHITVLNDGPVGKFGGAEIAALPWIPDRRAKTEIKQLKGDILLLHQSVAGCRQGGWVSKYGIEGKDYPQFKHVIAGHFHESQEFEKGFYVGSPHALNFNEEGEKGYWLVDVEGGEIIERKLIPIKSPKFVTMKVDKPGKPSTTDIIDILYVIEAVGDAYCKLRFTIPVDEIAELTIHLKRVAAELPKNIRMLVWEISAAGEPHLKGKSESKPGALPSIDAMMDRYVETSPAVEEGDREATLEVGVKILSEAR